MSVEDHHIDRIPEYVAGALSPAEHDTVTRHLPICAECQRELAAWQAIATGQHLLARRDALPDPLLFARISASIDAGYPPIPHTTDRGIDQAQAIWRRWSRIAIYQCRLLNPWIWVASLAGTAIATAIAVRNPGDGGSLILGVALPLIAACGAAFLYAPEIDAGMELALATATPPGLVMFSRWFLVFGFDLILALLATALLAWLGHTGFWPLTALWLGPMALLASLSLVLTLFTSPIVAAGGAIVLWLGRVGELGDGLWLERLHDGMIGTNVGTLALAVGLLVLAVSGAKWQQRWPFGA